MEVVRLHNGKKTKALPERPHIVEKDRLGVFEEEMGIAIAHDGRGGPFATRRDGTEELSLLVSFTDEDEEVLCGWARRETGSRLVGLGIDLVPLDAFAGERGQRLKQLLLTDRDREVADAMWPDEPEIGCAFAFSAKESAFKACAAPLRRWHESHDERLVFDLRSFELADSSHELGTARRGEAQRAMDAMGIAEIALGYELREPYILTWAFALSGDEHANGLRSAF